MKLIVTGVLIAVLAGSAGLAHAQSFHEIPTWVRNSALSWGQGIISHAEFSAAIQYLIDNDVIKVSEGSYQTPWDIKCGPGTHRNDTGTCVLTPVRADAEPADVAEPHTKTNDRSHNLSDSSVTKSHTKKARGWNHNPPVQTTPLQWFEETHTKARDWPTITGEMPPYIASNLDEYSMILMVEKMADMYWMFSQTCDHGERLHEIGAIIKRAGGIDSSQAALLYLMINSIYDYHTEHGFPTRIVSETENRFLYHYYRERGVIFTEPLDFKDGFDGLLIERDLARECVERVVDMHGPFAGMEITGVGVTDDVTWDEVEHMLAGYSGMPIERWKMETSVLRP